MAQYIGYVFQNPDQQLFASTVFEEVAFAPRKLGCNEHTIKTRVEEVLKITNLQECNLGNASSFKPRAKNSDYLLLAP